jgi:hypothetical protein
MRETQQLSVAPSLHLSVPLSLRLSVALAAWLCLSSTSKSQLRDSFEGPQPTWSLTREADCGVRELAHDRSFRDSRSGQASEHFRLQVGNGTYVYLAQSIGRAPVIQEFRPTLFLKADRPSLQLMARVVFPRSIDRGTDRSPRPPWRRTRRWASGSSRACEAALLEQETRHRTQPDPGSIPRGYVDLTVLDAYMRRARSSCGSRPGDRGLHHLDSRGAASRRRPAGQDARRAMVRHPAATARRPAPRVAGRSPRPFNIAASSSSGSARPASTRAQPPSRRPGKRLASACGSSPRRRSAIAVQGFDPVIAWSPPRLTDRKAVGHARAVSEVRATDGRIGRSGGRRCGRRIQPIINPVARAADVGTTQELADSRNGSSVAALPGRERRPCNSKHRSRARRTTALSAGAAGRRF